MKEQKRATRNETYEGAAMIWRLALGSGFETNFRTYRVRANRFLQFFH